MLSIGISVCCHNYIHTCMWDFMTWAMDVSWASAEQLCNIHRVWRALLGSVCIVKRFWYISELVYHITTICNLMLFFSMHNNCLHVCGWWHGIGLYGWYTHGSLERERERGEKEVSMCVSWLVGRTSNSSWQGDGKTGDSNDVIPSQVLTFNIYCMGGYIHFLYNASP